jgi:hypothetical protein
MSTVNVQHIHAMATFNNLKATKIVFTRSWESATGIIPIKIDMSTFTNKKILGISLLVTVDMQGRTQEFLTRGEG